MNRLNEVARLAGMGPGDKTPPVPPPTPEPEPEPQVPVLAVAVATAVGLVNSSTLNDCPAELQGWNEAKGRYSCCVHKPDGTAVAAFIKPGNLLLPAVFVRFDNATRKMWEIDFPCV